MSEDDVTVPWPMHDALDDDEAYRIVLAIRDIELAEGWL